MKNFLFIHLTVLIVVSCNMTGKTSYDSIATLEIDTDTNDSIPVEEYLAEKLNPIRAYVKEMDKTKEWSLVLKKELFLSTEGGEATFYNWNGKLKKIEVVYYGEMGQKQAQYYLKNDTLIFAFEKTLQYNRPIYHDSVAMLESNDSEVFDMDESDIVETEIYFEHGKLIRIISNQDCGAPFSEEYRQEEDKRIKEEFEEFRTLYVTEYTNSINGK